MSTERITWAGPSTSSSRSHHGGSLIPGTGSPHYSRVRPLCQILHYGLDRAVPNHGPCRRIPIPCPQRSRAPALGNRLRLRDPLPWSAGESAGGRLLAQSKRWRCARPAVRLINAV